jgi:D-3-phosphoglycerate dehydrogenase / 2-oxoglutarate reductase
MRPLSSSSIPCPTSPTGRSGTSSNPPAPTPAEADAAMVGADVVIVTGVRKFGVADIAALTRCVGVQTSSTGADAVHPDLEAREIPLRTAAGYCTEEVSDHAIALLLAAWRRVQLLDTVGRTARWVGTRTYTAPLRRLRGHTVGIVGRGRIGRAVAGKARGLGFEAIGYDPYVDVVAAAVPLFSLAALLGDSDAVVLCARATSETRHLINDRRLAQMKPGVVLVNVSRGALVDEAALVRALESGRSPSPRSMYGKPNPLPPMIP